MEPTTETPTGFNMQGAVDTIGQSLFPGGEAAPESEPSSAEPVAAEPSAEPSAEPAEATPDAPKSWPKEMRDFWGQTPKEVQAYWQTREKQMLDGLDQYKKTADFGRQLQDALTPYQQLLQQQQLEAPRAVQLLLNAHQRLTTGTVESRKAAYEELGRNLQLLDNAAANGQPADPRYQSLEQKVRQLEAGLTAQQQAVYAEAQTKASQEVTAFAADTAHAYFDEVADEMVPFIQAGASLKDAYEKAVWANPVTRQKEMARLQTETEAKAKERARLDALPKKQAAGVNVKGRESQRTPAEPLGSMEQTLRDTLTAIKSR